MEVLELMTGVNRPLFPVPVAVGTRIEGKERMSARLAHPLKGVSEAARDRCSLKILGRRKVLDLNVRLDGVSSSITLSWRG